MTHLPEDGSSGSQPSFPSPVNTSRTASVQPRPRASRPWIPLVVIALVVGMLSGAMSAVAVTNLMKPDSSAALTTSTAGGTTVSNVRLDETSAITDAVKKDSPAVVTIQVQSGQGS